MERSRAIVLMYHQIVADDCPDNWLPSPLADLRYGVSLSTFRRQMEAVRERRIPVVSISDWISGSVNRENKDCLSLIVTFDDGYGSDLALAAPVLDFLKFPATFFVSTGFTGKTGMMSWKGLESLARNSLFSIGSHGVSHRFLSNLSDEECRSELEKSHQRIMEVYRLLGRNRDVEIDLSVPGGRTSRNVARFARQTGFRSLMTSDSGILMSSGDLYSIPRLPVMASHSVKHFLRLLEPESFAFRMNRWVRSGKRLAGNLRDWARPSHSGGWA